MTRQLRIISDGTAPGTRVIDVESGEPVDGIVGVHWSCSVDELATVTLTLYGVPADVEAVEVNK